MKLNYTLGSKEEFQELHDYTIYLLENVGFECHHQEAADIFKTHGAKVEGTKVFLTRKMIESAIKTAPSSFEWTRRDGSSTTVGGDNTLLLPAYGPIYIREDDGIRNITHDDYIKAIKLHKTSDVLDAANPMLMEPSEIKKDIRNTYRMATTLKYSDKLVTGITSGGPQEIEECINMVKDYYDIHDKYVSMALVSTLCPLNIAPDMVDLLITYAKANQPVVIACCGAAELTNVASIAGGLALCNASILAALTLNQLINPGSPVVYALQASPSDLRYFAMPCAGPENNLLIYVAKEMAKFYDVPCRTGGGVVDSKCVDYQAGAEAYAMLFSSLHAKGNVVLHATGIVDNYNSYSFEKAILDEELIRMIRYELNGFEITEDRMELNRIKKVGPCGNFMGGRTSKFYRKENYFTNAFCRELTQNWINEGSVDAYHKAKIILDDRINSYTLPETTKAQDAILAKYIPKELA